MHRRQFCRSLSTVAGLGAVGVLSPVWAQGRPVEGQHYKRLRTVQPTSNKQGEVLEFFWYGCPFCYQFDPALSQWVARSKPAAVSFKRVPAIIHGASREHQRIFYALELMGQEEAVHSQVFTAVQADPAGLKDLPDIQALMRKLGVDAGKFGEMYQSFTVQTRCQQANAMLGNYEGTGVPLLAVNGRFITSPTMAGGIPQALAVLDFLLSGKAG